MHCRKGEFVFVHLCRTLPGTQPGVITDLLFVPLSCSVCSLLSRVRLSRRFLSRKRILVTLAGDGERKKHKRENERKILVSSSIRTGRQEMAAYLHRRPAWMGNPENSGRADRFVRRHHPGFCAPFFIFFAVLARRGRHFPGKLGGATASTAAPRHHLSGSRVGKSPPARSTGWEGWST